MKTADIKVDYVGHFGSDLEVVNAARVSFEKESAWEQIKITEDENGPVPLYYDYKLNDSDVKLINYLAKHKHFSPFNHAFLSFRIKAPIFVARQLVKHKFLPWNEVSRRYVDSEPEFYFPKYWREKAENVKQGSKEEPMEEGSISMGFSEAIERSYMEYTHMIKYANVCPEQARMVLPLNTMTEWVWSGTLGAFLDMLVLRLDPHTQYESRIVAQQIAKVVEQYFPASYKARIE